MKLSDMRQVLNAEHIQLTKSLGQNFLHDQNQLQKIASAASLAPADKVLEIGPGLGPLTDLLLEKAGEVIAIEKDQRLVELLQKRLGQNAKFRLLHDDALRYVEKNRDWKDWKLVANLPYSVASPILIELAEAENPPERIVVTLQLEVAKRIMAKCGDEDYGVMSLLMQLRYEPQGLFKIPSDCFFPPPEVDSACITLVKREASLLSGKQADAFKRIVKLALSQRRKMMLKLLKQNWPKEKLEAAFAELGLSPQIRAEKVTLAQFIQLTQLLTS